MLKSGPGFRDRAATNKKAGFKVMSLRSGTLI